MAKRFIISEEERSDIRSRYGLVNEQNEPIEYKKAVQCFLNKKGYKDDSNKPLNVDGRWDSRTQEALRKYQSKIKVDTDGVWGPMTYNKMPNNDVQIFKQCVSDEGDLIDKGLHFFGLD
jgi:peptidoglycan hydrolase-like protein with peptidoglycan-binding domain